MKNALSIDFEDWFQPFAARGVDGWERFPSRVPADTERLLAVIGELQSPCMRCSAIVSPPPVMLEPS